MIPGPIPHRRVVAQGRPAVEVEASEVPSTHDLTMVALPLHLSATPDGSDKLLARLTHLAPSMKLKQHSVRDG